MATLFMLVPLFSSLVLLSLLAYVFGQRRRHPVNRAFFLFFGDLFILTFIEFLLRLPQAELSRDFLMDCVGIAAAFVGATFYGFISAVVGKKPGILYRVFYGASFVSAIVSLIPAFTAGKSISVAGSTILAPSSVLALQALLVLVPPVVAAAWLAVAEFIRSKDPQTRRELGFLLGGTVLGVSYAILVLGILPHAMHWYQAIQLSSIGVVLPALTIFRAVHKHMFLSIDMEKELARARQIESLGTLAGGIAHDFNNLLTGMMGAFSLIKTISDPKSETYELATEGEKAALRGEKLTHQLLTFAKGGEPVKEAVALSTLISDTVSFAIRGSKCTLSMSIADDIGSQLLDRGQMAQVFHNLTINAVQAMPQGGAISIVGSIRTDLTSDLRAANAGAFVEIRFSDTGLGIDDKVISRIFDPYFTTKSSGSGIGLTTVHSIIKRHGGFISVASVVGSGTTFTLLLPYCKAPSPPPSKPPSGNPDTIPAATIVVVDDEDGVRMSLTKMLKQLGHCVVGFSSGDEALRAHQRMHSEGTKGAAWIIDLTMPGGLSGTELGTKLRAADPTLPLIITSGYSDDRTLSHFRDYGFAAALRKPYNIDSVRVALSEALARSA